MVQFYTWFKFYFHLFLGTVMYNNELKTLREIKFKPRIKLNHKTYIIPFLQKFQDFSNFLL